MKGGGAPGPRLQYPRRKWLVLATSVPPLTAPAVRRGLQAAGVECPDGELWQAQYCSGREGAAVDIAPIRHWLEEVEPAGYAGPPSWLTEL